MKLRCASTFLVLILCGIGRADTVIVTGHVTDAAGRPVAGAKVASFWSADGDAMKAHDGVATDVQGAFSLELEHGGRAIAVLALDKERKTGGLIGVDPKAPLKDVNLKLQPLVRVRGNFFCKEMNFKPAWTNVYMTTADGARFLQCSSTDAAFSFLVPPGAYRFDGYGTDIQNLRKDMKFTADVPVVDLKTLDAPASGIAKHGANALPKWHVTDARGVKKDVSLTDYKGKWVLVEFFAHWCGPCVQRSLPVLIDLYEDQKQHRDQFEILAFHVEFASGLKDYDEKIKVAKKKFWKDQELPFPLLLDATEETSKAFGIKAFPTSILIDPEGKLVDRSHQAVAKLEKKLPPVAPSRALDHLMMQTIGGDLPLRRWVRLLAARLRVNVRFDEPALKAAGVSPDDTVPLDLSARGLKIRSAMSVPGPLTSSSGGRLTTLRSCLDLVLAAHDLTFKVDDKGILITTKSAGSVPPKLSGPQEMAAKRIADRLSEKKSFEFKEATLADVAAHFEKPTEENFVLDPAARKAGKLKPDAKVSGAFTDLPVGDSLKKLLEPLHLTIVVRDEVVVITPQ